MASATKAARRIIGHGVRRRSEGGRALLRRHDDGGQPRLPTIAPTIDGVPPLLDQQVIEQYFGARNIAEGQVAAEVGEYCPRIIRNIINIA